MGSIMYLKQIALAMVVVYKGRYIHGIADGGTILLTNNVMQAELFFGADITDEKVAKHIKNNYIGNSWYTNYDEDTVDIAYEDLTLELWEISMQRYPHTLAV